MDDRDLIAEAYRDFNARQIDAVLARMHPDVTWANGMEGGYVHGVEAVRAYWTRQWQILDPHVEPFRIEPDNTGRLIVHVHQTVHDLEGKLILDTVVHHAYRIRNGLIEQMDISSPETVD
jgi:hypothetical protein